MSIKRTILIADDEALMRRNLREVLREEGYHTEEATNGTDALERTLALKPDLLILDHKMPGMSGIEVLAKVKKSAPSIPVILFTAFGSSERPIEAMKLGAYDYVEKPFDLDELLLIIQRAIGYADVVQELQQLREEADTQSRIRETLIGSSARMQTIFKMIGKIANSDTSVLLQGETGSGKEMIADAIQRYSNRSEGPFVKVNCGALPESLLESELFGHEAGAFTGAVKQRIGRFELADNGTIFLDEIDSMSASLQVKLLRVLQKQTFERVGGEKTIQVNLRVICATNHDIEQLVKEGRFREDLYYRLNVIHLHIPPLRDHIDDVPPLVDHFLDKYSPAKRVILSRPAMNLLMQYHWPGNVRELENTIQRALVLSNGSAITPEHLPAGMQGVPVFTDSFSSEKGKTLKHILQRVEKQVIEETLRSNDWNQTQAAEQLGINRRQLFTKMNQYGLRKPV